MITFHLKVVPNASKHRFSLAADGTIVCYLVSQPEKGKANQELIKHLAKSLSIPQRQVQIIQGDTVRYKKILIDSPISLADLYRCLGLPYQQSLQ